MDAIRRELSQAGRRLLRSPAFAIAAVTTLSLAVAANLAIFTLVHRVVLNPLPYPDSERLIQLEHAAPGLNAAGGIGMTLGLFEEYRAGARLQEAMALYETREATLTGIGEPERILVVRATQSLAGVLGVSPAVGRWFLPDEALPDGPPVAVLSDGIWQRRFGGDQNIVGRTVIIDGAPVTVVGIMPRSFTFPDAQVQAWTLRHDAPSQVFDDFSFQGVGRLREGVSIEAARAELSGIIAQLPLRHPDNAGIAGIVNRAKLTSVARTLKQAKVGRIARTLLVLLAAVAFVLIVACANIANLFLVRADGRHSEMALRRALGAGRSQIARYAAAESALIAGLGGVLGLALAWAAVRVLVHVSPSTLPRLEEIALDLTTALYAVAIAVMAAAVFTTTSLWRATPAHLALHAQGRWTTAGRSRQRARNLLVGAQVALAVVLLVASSLMVRSFQNLRAIDPQFNPSSALTFRIGLSERSFPTRSARLVAHHALLDRLAALPGVTAVTAATRVPLTAAGRELSSTLRVEGRPVATGVVPPLVAFRAVAGGYFEAMGTRVLRGRGIERGDTERAEAIAVVNAALARLYFPGQDPIGARVARGGSTVNSSWLTIVGVVANTPNASLAEATDAGSGAELYLPMSISGPPEVPGQSANGPAIATMSYVVRSATAPLGLLPAIRESLDAIDATVAIAQVHTLQDLLDRASSQVAFTMALLALAAGMALLLGLVGIYGAVSYAVSQRTREIGVRLALGADLRSISAMIVKQSVLVTLAGLAVGLAGALASGHLIEALLYGVSPRDPTVFALAMLTMIAVATAACWLPARRAARVDPVHALRAD